MRVQRPNFRRHRALALNCEIMRVVSKFLQTPEHYENNDERDCSRKILELLMRDGVEVLTDADRAHAGLEPRGPDGWTMSEIHAYEARRLAVMLSPMPATMPGVVS